MFSKRKMSSNKLEAFFTLCFFRLMFPLRAGYTHLLLDKILLATLQRTSQVNWQRTKQNVTTAKAASIRKAGRCVESKVGSFVENMEVFKQLSELIILYINMNISASNKKT